MCVAKSACSEFCERDRVVCFAVGRNKKPKDRRSEGALLIFFFYQFEFFGYPFLDHSRSMGCQNVLDS